MEKYNNSDNKSVALPDEDIKAIANFQVLMVAAYALGIASPRGFFEASEYVIKKVAEHFNPIMEKIATWAKYGEIIGVRDLTAEMNHDYATDYMWMITDQNVVIISAIKNNCSMPSYRVFREKWNFEGGILSDLTDFTFKHFIEAAPKTLVLDDSIEKFSLLNYQSPSRIYAPNVTDSEAYYCHSLKWVKRIILPPGIEFIAENFDHACIDTIDELMEKRGAFWKNDYRNIMHLPADLYDNGVGIMYSSAFAKPYYINNNIIYRISDNKEVCCLDTETRKKRYISAFERGIVFVTGRLEKEGAVPVQFPMQFAG